MPYKYTALSVEGHLRSGHIDAEDETSAEEALSQAGYRVLTLKTFKTAPPVDTLFPSFFGVKSGQVIGFSKQLASLLEAGIDIVKAMEIVGEQTPSGAMARILKEMQEKLQGGSPLSAVLNQYPNVFGPTYRKMVEVGEQTGCLEAALKQAAGYMEKQREAAKKIGKALVYPCIVTGVAVVVVVLLIVLVLPAMAGLFTSLGAQLPLPTRALIAGGNFVKTNYLIVILAIAAMVGLVYSWMRRPVGRRKVDRMLLRMPAFGPVILYGEISRFAGTMATLLRAGVTVAESAQLATGACRNGVIKEAVKNATEELMQGRGLSRPLARSGVFPAMMIQMVRVGEETGSLDNTLSVVAASYETEATERSQALIAMLEPALTVGIAVAVGFIALSVVMPIYSVLGSIK
ncbi:MAG: type II secretion system F family protein [Chloroflexi bacterium]|nr:type II secretion system F family protein [Chloroflexota bacterium]